MLWFEGERLRDEIPQIGASIKRNTMQMRSVRSKQNLTGQSHVDVSRLVPRFLGHRGPAIPTKQRGCVVSVFHPCAGDGYGSSRYNRQGLGFLFLRLLLKLVACEKASHHNLLQESRALRIIVL